MRRTVRWVLGSLAAVALSVAMPLLALYVQDVRLAGTVEYETAETADLSLLSDLTTAQTLTLVRDYESRVELDQGRVMNAATASGAAMRAADFFSAYDVEGSATPWLYIGPSGESVVLWQVDMSGYGINALAAATDAGLRAMSITALVDERSGNVVSLFAQWQTEETETVLTEGPTGEIITAVPYVDPASCIQEFAFYLLSIDPSFYWLDVGEEDNGMFLYLYYAEGNAEVPWAWDVSTVRFNAVG